MKILFINSRSYDYLQDISFSGLIKALGPAQLCHWPPNPKFILPFKTYPKNLGFHSASALSASWQKPDIKKFDVVMVGACKPDAFQFYLKIAASIPRQTLVVLLDGGDREEIGGDLARLGKNNLFEEARAARDFNLIFKREYLEGNYYPDNIKPLPFGFNFSRLPSLPNEQKYQVTFWAVESHPIRTQALQLLQNNFDCTKNGTTLNQTFKKYKRKGKFYLQELASSNMALNFRGGGWDTLRYWEIPAVSRLMISQKPAIVIPNNFEHNKHAVFCKDDLTDLIDLCAYFLKENKKREAIAQAGHNHAVNYHSDLARAKYILQTIEGIRRK